MLSGTHTSSVSICCHGKKSNPNEVFVPYINRPCIMKNMFSIAHQSNANEQRKKKYNKQYHCNMWSDFHCWCLSIMKWIWSDSFVVNERHPHRKCYGLDLKWYFAIKIACRTLCLFTIYPSVKPMFIMPFLWVQVLPWKLMNGSSAVKYCAPHNRFVVLLVKLFLVEAKQVLSCESYWFPQNEQRGIYWGWGIRTFLEVDMLEIFNGFNLEKHVISHWTIHWGSGLPHTQSILLVSVHLPISNLYMFLQLNLTIVFLVPMNIQFAPVIFY